MFRFFLKFLFERSKLLTIFVLSSKLFSVSKGKSANEQIYKLSVWKTETSLLYAYAVWPAVERTSGNNCRNINPEARNRVNSRLDCQRLSTKNFSKKCSGSGIPTRESRNQTTKSKSHSRIFFRNVTKILELTFKIENQKSSSIRVLMMLFFRGCNKFLEVGRFYPTKRKNKCRDWFNEKKDWTKISNKFRAKTIYKYLKKKTKTWIQDKVQENMYK